MSFSFRWLNLFDLKILDTSMLSKKTVVLYVYLSFLKIIFLSQVFGECGRTPCKGASGDCEHPMVYSETCVKRPRTGQANNYGPFNGGGLWVEVCAQRLTIYVHLPQFTTSCAMLGVCQFVATLHLSIKSFCYDHAMRYNKTTPKSQIVSETCNQIASQSVQRAEAIDIAAVQGFQHRARVDFVALRLLASFWDAYTSLSSLLSLYVPVRKKLTCRHNGFPHTR